MPEPLAERLRPQRIEDFVGQEHLVGLDGVIRKMIENEAIQSIILWGPPGTGKTTLARIIAKASNRQFYTLSAISSGVKDVRDVIEKAKKTKFFDSPAPILFIDEIHRFSKSQQDALLAAVEEGTIILIGATTENPSFEVISPLLSRCNVYILKSLEKHHLEILLQKAITQDEILSKKKIKILETEKLFLYSGGDARKLLSIIETIVATQNAEPIYITNQIVAYSLQQRHLKYDKTGEFHYDIISAFIKSVRGSDPDAAVYWLARMIDAGEDIKFIARRLIILASEDIGLANPNALLLAQSCFNAVAVIGMPEARIVLSQTAIYLATSPKSNSAYLAIDNALEIVKKTGELDVPLHLRNAPTNLMKQLGYGQDYKYAHAYENNFVEQQFLPDELVNQQFYIPGHNPQEDTIVQRLQKWWKNRWGKK